MSVKAILVLCAQALLLKCCGPKTETQSALGQCTSRAAVADISGLAAPYGLAAPCGWSAPALSYGGLGYPGAGCTGLEFSPTSGGALPVSSASGNAPVGISVVSDNAYEGSLAVGGELPFVGTVGLEGVVPSAGAGAVNHACGNGRNAMISETAAFGPAGPYAAYGPSAAFAPAGFGTPGLGFRGGYAGRCGCGI